MCPLEAKLRLLPNKVLHFLVETLVAMFLVPGLPLGECEGAREQGYCIHISQRYFEVDHSLVPRLPLGEREGAREQGYCIQRYFEFDVFFPPLAIKQVTVSTSSEVRIFPLCVLALSWGGLGARLGTRHVLS